MHYFQSLKESFERNADPVYARGAKAYMRGLSEFYGLGSPLRRELYRDFIRQSGYLEPSQLENLVSYCWEQPQREWQYVGLEMTEHFARKGNPDLLKLAEFMITHKSWWDTVDFVAPNIAGAILKKNPSLIRMQIEDWMSSGNLWLLRSGLLFQLRYKFETDEALLFELCERLSGHKDFFIRKAIGWSLREHSKRNPLAVTQFVGSHNLSPLSQREALKIINKTRERV
ncbi:MAG: DNA alkylation repair protein [Bacteroidetes bacterium]|nr:DNA alkylation repair protein [Bacteroidota bacterium]